MPLYDPGTAEQAMVEVVGVGKGKGATMRKERASKRGQRRERKGQGEGRPRERWGLDKSLYVMRLVKKIDLMPFYIYCLSHIAKRTQALSTVFRAQVPILCWKYPQFKDLIEQLACQKPKPDETDPEGFGVWLTRADLKIENLITLKGESLRQWLNENEQQRPEKFSVFSKSFAHYSSFKRSSAWIFQGGELMYKIKAQTLFSLQSDQLVWETCIQKLLTANVLTFSSSHLTSS
ncbi:hypothetical protein T439DRAFT_337823 [Meredithblackwellia eburnea MCA 4105]